MKRLTLTLIFTTVSLLMFSQSNYYEAIKQGDDAAKSGNYTTAIRKYLVARAFDESKRAEVQVKLDAVYKKIDDELAEYRGKDERVNSQNGLNKNNSTNNVPPKPTTHTIEKGETLTSIADKYGTNVKKIKELNGLKKDNIKAGNTLKIPQK